MSLPWAKCDPQRLIRRTPTGRKDRRARTHRDWRRLLARFRIGQGTSAGAAATSSCSTKQITTSPSVLRDVRCVVRHAIAGGAMGAVTGGGGGGGREGEVRAPRVMSTYSLIPSQRKRTPSSSSLPPILGLPQEERAPPVLPDPDKGPPAPSVQYHICFLCPSPRSSFHFSIFSTRARQTTSAACVDHSRARRLFPFRCCMSIVPIHL